MHLNFNSPGAVLGLKIILKKVSITMKFFKKSFFKQITENFLMLGTIHKRRRPKGGGRGVPPKGDVRRWGGGTLSMPEETFFYDIKLYEKAAFLTDPQGQIRILKFINELEKDLLSQLSPQKDV